MVFGPLLSMFLGGGKKSVVGQVLGAVTGGVGGTQGRRRRRRRKLTAGQLQELAMIKSTLGRTAAANALPFYLK